MCTDYIIFLLWLRISGLTIAFLELDSFSMPGSLTSAGRPYGAGYLFKGGLSFIARTFSSSNSVVKCQAQSQ